MAEGVFSLEDEIADSLLEAKEDYVGLWEVSETTKDYFGQGEQACEQALEVVYHLILRGMQAGNLIRDNSFIVWPDQDPTSVVDRIRQEWIVLGEDPTIGDIAWSWLPN